MANYKVTDSELSGIASAIRLKGGTSDPLVFPTGFVSAISEIETKGIYISKIITSNGEYDPASDNADAFSHVTVSVPAGSSPVLVSKSISENGTYYPVDDNADAYSQVIVNVSGGGGGGDLSANYLIAMGASSGIISDSKVSEICSFAFYKRGTQSMPITGLSLDEATTIGASAFQMCDRLSFVYLSKCTSIGDAAFSLCTGIENLSLPLCETIGNYAFYTCNRIENLELPECTTIGGYAFGGCWKLASVSIPKCETIGSYAFSSCVSLTNVFAPEVALISSSAFLSCKILEQISFPECTTLKDYAFYNCTSLATAYLPKIEQIGGDAFGYTKITELNLSKLNILAYGCLEYMSLLSMVSLTKCSYIQNNAFYNDSSLTAVYLLSESVATLQASTAFYNTPIQKSSYTGTFGSIYVPSSLVDSYKAASYWSYFADRITAYVEE